MVNRKLLLGKAMAKNISCKDIAEALNIDPATLSQKLGNKSDFKIKEVQTIQKLLNLTKKDTESIFFN